MLTDTTFNAMIYSFNNDELWNDGWSEKQIQAFFDRLYK